jgi:hypothetical protein
MDLFDTVRSKALLTFFKRIDAIMESLSNERLSDIVLTLERLSHRQWFDRIWVVQEMVTAQWPVLLAGSH